MFFDKKTELQSRGSVENLRRDERRRTEEGWEERGRRGGGGRGRGEREGEKERGDEEEEGEQVEGGGLLRRGELGERGVEEKLPELKEAYECGKHEFMAEATSRLVEHIRNNDTKMLQYFMDNSMKYRQNDQSQITITQEFLEKPLKIVSGDGNYEDELMDKYYKKIMSIKIDNNVSNEE